MQQKAWNRRLATLLSLVLAITACSGDSDIAATTSPSTAATSATPATPTSADATTTSPGVTEPLGIGSVTINDSACTLDIAEELGVGTLRITARNNTSAEAAFEVFKLSEGHSFAELVAHVEEEVRRADAGEPFLGPPLEAAAFASGGSGIMEAGESTDLTIEADDDGIYAIYCFRHHANTTDPVRPFALLGPLRVGDAGAALSPRGYQIMVGVNEEIGVLMAGGVTGSPPIGSFTLDDAWSFRAAEGWINLAQSDVPIFGTAAAFDRQSGRVIVVGEETWSYDILANVWRTENVDIQPSGTLGAVATYDAGSDLVILFTTRGQTWAYDHETNTWSDLAPTASPPARDFSMIAYDEESDRVILFGGFRNRNDTWAYDYETNTWTDMAPADPPPGRQYGAAVYDPGSDRMILFGGEIEPSYDALGDTWAYDHNTNTWIEIPTDVAPEARGRLAMAYNPADLTIVLFGGGFGRDWENRPAGTWIFDPSTDIWAEVP